MFLLVKKADVQQVVRSKQSILPYFMSKWNGYILDVQLGKHSLWEVPMASHEECCVTGVTIWAQCFMNSPFVQRMHSAAACSPEEHRFCLWHRGQLYKQQMINALKETSLGPDAKFFEANRKTIINFVLSSVMPVFKLGSLYLCIITGI